MGALRRWMRGRKPATERQIAYIQSLISQWDPGSSQHYSGASRATYRGALGAAGLPDYHERTVSKMNRKRASEAIDRLIAYDVANGGRSARAARKGDPRRKRA